MVRFINCRFCVAGLQDGLSEGRREPGTVGGIVPGKTVYRRAGVDGAAAFVASGVYRHGGSRPRTRLSSLRESGAWHDAY
ncbi:MAG: hypothetical protein ACKOJF_15475 [Planctomycetaceae bacterium]